MWDFVVLGLGLSGYTMARFLFEQGYTVAVTDSRLQPPYLSQLQTQYPQILIKTGEFDSQLIDNAKRLAVSPGVNLHSLGLMPEYDRVIGEIEIFAQFCSPEIPVVAITGTNGKTTVTTLVGQMLQAGGYSVGLGGNIGTPALDLLSQSYDYYVLELSSFQLELTFSLHPAVATILNLTADHLDRYDSMLSYQQAKQRIYRYADCCVYYRDDELTYPQNTQAQCCVSFADNAPLTENDYGLIVDDNDRAIVRGKQLLLHESDLTLRGGHHSLNAMAALALVDCLGGSLNEPLICMSEFKGLPHRCEVITQNSKQFIWINDSKATNLAALLSDVYTVTQQYQGASLALLVGGRLKDADLSAFTEQIPLSVSHVVAFGESVQAWLNAAPVHVRTHACDTLQAAVTYVQSHLSDVDIVMLTPGGSSFDEFANYEKRGEAFKHWIQEVDHA